MPGKFPQSHGFERGQVGREPPGKDHPHLLKRACGRHPGKPSVDRGIESFARRQQHDGGNSGPRGADLGLLPLHEGPAGPRHHLVGADEALTIAGIEPRRCVWISLRQGGVESLAADLLVECARCAADIRGNLRHRRQPPEQCLQIKARATHDDWQAAVASGGGDLCFRERKPARGRAELGSVEHAEEPVRHPRELRGTWPRGQHRQIAIDLHAVGVDHGAAEFLGHGNRQPRLSARGRAGDQEDGSVAARHRPCV